MSISYSVNKKTRPEYFTQYSFGPGKLKLTNRNKKMLLCHSMINVKNLGMSTRIYGISCSAYILFDVQLN